MKTKEERNTVKGVANAEQKKTDKIEDAKQLTDEELETATGGMKIIIDEQPSWLRPLLRLIFKIKS